MKTDYAFISTPLSAGFRSRLEQTLQSSPNYLPLAELRRLPPAQMLKKLLTLNAERVVVPVEDHDSFAFVPAALALASITNTRRIILVKPDQQSEEVSRWQAGARLVDTLKATAQGALATRDCRREVAKLLAEPRLQLPPPAVGRVLYLRTNLSFGVRAGGSVGHVAGVINGLSRTGFPVDVAAIDRPAMLDPDVRLRPLRPLAAFGFPYDTNLHRFDRSVAQQALAMTRDERYSFLYQRLSISSYAGAMVSRAARLPLVVEYNGSEAWVASNWAVPMRDQALALDAERALLKHAHVVITISDVLKRELEENGVEPERVVMYPNCVDPRVYDPARFPLTELRALRARLGIPPDAIVAAFVGTFGQWHGVDVLARTIVRMVRQMPERLAASRLHFMFVGDGLLMPKVRETLAAPDVAARCTLCGLVPQAEAPAHVAAADILLSPHVDNADGSRFFGSPTKLFEYMALQRPIIASDLEQIGEVLRHSVRVDALPQGAPTSQESRVALLCRPGNEEDLAQALLYLADRPDWRAALGANARREALSRYTWDRHVAAVTDRLRRA